MAAGLHTSPNEIIPAVRGLNLVSASTVECELNKMQHPEVVSRRFREAAITAIAVASLTAASTATAQQLVRPPAANEAPQSTAATYGDWVVQCQMQSGTPPKKICAMAQVTQVQGKNVPFSRVMIAEPEKSEPLKLVVQVPVNASFATMVRVQTTASDPGMAASFARCVPLGCFADFEINEETLKKLRAATGAGKLTFPDAGGRDVVIPVSFKGFSAALDALMRG